MQWRVIVTSASCAFKFLASFTWLMAAPRQNARVVRASHLVFLFFWYLWPSSIHKLPQSSKGHTWFVLDDVSNNCACRVGVALERNFDIWFINKHGWQDPPLRNSRIPSRCFIPGSALQLSTTWMLNRNKSAVIPENSAKNLSYVFGAAILSFYVPEFNPPSMEG